jgi:hypothetical protein
VGGDTGLWTGLSSAGAYENLLQTTLHSVVTA